MSHTLHMANPVVRPAIACLTMLLSLSTCFGVHAQSLTIGEGVVVKFGVNSGMTVRSKLRTDTRTVFTSLSDDTYLGQTATQPGIPVPGDWRGVRVDSTVTAENLQIRGLTLRYAGAQTSAAFEFRGGTYVIDYVDIADSLIGIRATESADLGISGASLNRNDVALEASQESLVEIVDSDISGNAFGVLNLTPEYVVSAAGNWWGSATGPTAMDNPSGGGDEVSEGVDYGDFLTGIPLIDCSLSVLDGNYKVALPQVQLAMHCRNAFEYRLSATSDFGEISFQPMQSTAEYTLEPPAGSKRIFAEYRATTGNSRVVPLAEPINYTPGAPVVSIASPAPGAEVVTDTVIVANASAASGVEHVQFYIGSQHIGTIEKEPYEQLWQIEGFAPGDYNLSVKVRSRTNQTAQVSQLVRLRPDGVDPAPVIISDVRFNGGLLSHGSTLSNPGSLSFSVTAPSGVAGVTAHLGQTPLSGSIADGTYRAWLDFSSIENGNHELRLSAVNAFDVVTEEVLAIEVDVAAPPAPVLVAPQDSTVMRPQVVISGTAQPGSSVQIYLDDEVSGALLPVGSTGTFSSTLMLPEEGTYRVSADATNSRGTGPRSTESWVTYMPSDPEVVFTNPAPGSVISADTDLSVAIIDATGITEVHYAVDGQTVSTLTSAPWTWRWPISGVPDGAHTLSAQAVNLAGRTGEAHINVVVQKAPPPPPPVLTPYVGELTSLTPPDSFGEQPITLTGRALEREAGTPVPNALLRVVLETGGYQRKINVATDDTGSFSFLFQPDPTDAGTYQVSIQHPDQTDASWQGEFTIDRVKVTPTRYNLRAARTVVAKVPIKVSASAGNGVNGLRLEATPSEQPSGSLPPGVQVTVPSAVTLGPGAERTLEVEFLASENAPATGTIVLAAYAQQSGSAVRGRVSVPFQVREPQPALVPKPVSLQGGLAHGGRLVLATQLSNQGLLAAHNVAVEIVGESASASPPDWVQLSSPALFETMPVGASQPIEISANPMSSVIDGVHYMCLHVTADNAAGGYIPVAISVTQSGAGAVQFHAANIYTQTLDEHGIEIPGLADARIRLQHETIPTLTAEVNTDQHGIGVISDMPAGRYTWRASAPDHAAASGRVHIQPGITVAEDVFLDMEVISIEWEVTETTIEDEYEVAIEAVYQTHVPAPVVVIEPVFVNLPPLQVGEEFSGELTISNYGLVRADNVAFTPPATDAYFHYEFMGDVPESIDARERVRIAYKVTALQPITAGTVPLVPMGEPLGAALSLSNTTSSGSCRSYRGGASLRYDYECANGTTRSGSGAATWGRTSGSGCGTSGGGAGGGGPWGSGGGWGGTGGGGRGVPLSGGPGCTPNCEKCCTGGGSSGGG